MIFLYILLAIVLLLALLNFIAPKGYRVERSIIIDKPVKVVFDYIKYLKNQDNWTPWSKKDPNSKREFSGTDGEIGFVSAWDGNKEVGSGEQEILNIIENERLETELRFFKPWKSVSEAYIYTEPAEGNQTKVIWGFTGRNKFPFHIMMLFMNMDKTVGKDFEEGLNNLEEVLKEK